MLPVLPNHILHNSDEVERLTAAGIRLLTEVDGDLEDRDEAVEEALPLLDEDEDDDGVEGVLAAVAAAAPAAAPALFGSRSSLTVI